MRHEQPTDITVLLHQWQDGDRKALDVLLPLVYKQPRRQAHYQLRNERPDYTLQSAALVHEAYLRLIGIDPPAWGSRTQFFAIAAQFMRQILVDYARRHRAAKRGGGDYNLSIEDAAVLGKSKDVDVVALDEALQALSRIDPRQSRVVELKFFGGLSLEQIATAPEIGTATVQRDWTAARAWLHREMKKSQRI